MALRRIPLADGRTLALDDVGDPDGVPLLYLHGTPDSRHARHPDDRLAGEAGIRLLAVDRPGAGDSDLDPAGTPTSLGHDLAQALDALDLGRAALLGWSSGGLAALGAATVLGGRVDPVVLVATLPPAEAYADPVVVEALGPSRRPLVELAEELAPAEVAREVAPYLVPVPITPELAREHVLEGAGDLGRAELAAVPGATEALVLGLQAAVRQGTHGLEQDLRDQLTPGLDLGAIAGRVLVYQGERDGVAPPEAGRWIVGHVPQGVLEVVPGAGHHVLFALWPGLLQAVRILAGP